MAPAREHNITATLQNLSLNKSKHKRVQDEDKEPIAESWEQDSSSEDEHAAGHKTTSPPPRTPFPPVDYPAAPPPTPSSPSQRPNVPLTDFSRLNAKSRPTSSSDDWIERRAGERPMSSSEAARPEKTTAAASRMIAGALGVRVPKRTEEEKRYEKAVREKEVAKREREREDKTREVEERVRARASVWDG